MTSSYFKYEAALFALQRAGEVSALLGEFVLGVSTLGADADAWIDVPMASVAISGGYTADQNGTLIVDSTQATVSISSWTDPGPVLIAGDKIRVTYDDKVMFTGIVDSTSLTTVADPAAQAFGSSKRFDFSASAVDLFWIALMRVVSWTSLPGEKSIERVSRYVTVEGF